MNPLARFTILTVGFAGLAAAAALFLDAAEPHGTPAMAAVLTLTAATAWVLAFAITHTYKGMDDHR